MSTTTNKLKLFKYDPVADANNTFNITNALNNNFDNIESKTGVVIYDNTATYSLGDWVLGIVDGEKKIFESLANSNTGNALTDDTKWEEVKLGGNCRNIGEIVQSTIPLTDANLHLLDGSLLAYGSYKAFIDYIADLYDSGDYDDIFETEANWQSTVLSNGVCGKFVYDSVNNTVRLPKITGFTESTIDTTTVGDLTQAGLPNITGAFEGGALFGSGVGTATSGAFSATTTVLSRVAAATSGTQTVGIGFDASDSNSIYGNSNTVQPQSIKVLYYIVIATSTKTDIEVDIDEIATDLNGKADVDLSNCTRPHIVETYASGTSWYRVYSDGFVMQGGSGNFPAGDNSIAMLKLCAPIGGWYSWNSSNYVLTTNNGRLGFVGTYPNVSMDLNSGSQTTEYITWVALGWLQ